MDFFKSRKKISLVLGGGGARGLAHIGVIRALIAKGYVVDEVVGCSIGALVGAAYAQGKLDELESWMASITKMQMLKLMDFGSFWHGLMKGTKIFESLKMVFDDVAIEDLPIRYLAVATDLKTETEVVFNSGSIYQAIRASIAIPAVFTGVDIEDKYLVDGGVLNPLPINQVSRRRRNIVIAVNLDGMPLSEYGPLTTDRKLVPVTVLQEAYYAMRRRLSQLAITLHKPDYVISIPHNISGMWDYHRTGFLVEKGYAYADGVIPDLKKRPKEQKPVLSI